MDTNAYPIASTPKPAVGEIYTDPVFKSQIVRLTDAATILDVAKGDGSFVRHCTPEYPPVNAWSYDNSFLLLMYRSYFGLYRGTGEFITELPIINASAQPRWSRKSNKFYWISGNALMVYDVETDKLAPLRAFSEYSTINGKGESDTAAVGDLLVLVGNDYDAFIYDVEADVKYPIVNIPVGSDSVYISPSGMGFTCTEPDGIYYFSKDGKTLNRLVQLIPRDKRRISWLTGPKPTLIAGGVPRFLTGKIAVSGSHMDMCSVGGVEALVRTNSNDNPPLSGCDNGIEFVPLLDPGSRRCLLPLPYDGWDEAVHVSCDDVGNAVVETYIAPGAQWGPFANEIGQINIATGDVKRLCQHRSAVASYECMPLTSVRRDGAMAVFGSNWGDPNGVMDAYLLRIAAPGPVPVPVPTPIPTPTPTPVPTPVPHPKPPHPHRRAVKKKVSKNRRK